MTKHLTLVAAILLSITSIPAAIGENHDAITLSDRCPAGFVPDEENRCILNSLYREYPSLQERGMGGLKIGLPAVRDGFTPQQIDLGRYLFFDPILSGDQSISCATCHEPEKSFTDGRARSIGITGKEVGRSAPSLWNVGLQDGFFWDGRADTLEEQMLGPLYDKSEMGNTPEALLKSLNDNAEYRRLFSVAFPDDTPGVVSLEQIYTAITAFETSLVSLNSRYDYYAHGVHEALSPAEIDGLNIFRSFVARCAECHTPPLFTNQQIAVIGTPEPEGYARDPGRAAVTGDPTQLGGFRVPTLRNIVKTGPYMHSGRFDSLREAVAFYTGGRGHALSEGEELSLHWHIWEPNLSDTEIDRIVDFLGALSDESYMPEAPTRLPSGLPLTRLQNQQAKEQNR